MKNIVWGIVYEVRVYAVHLRVLTCNIAISEACNVYVVRGMPDVLNVVLDMGYAATCPRNYVTNHMTHCNMGYTGCSEVYSMGYI